MGLLFFDRTKDGRGLTLGSKLSADDLAKGVKLEEHVSIFEDFLATAGDGTYGYQGDYAGNSALTVPKAVVGANTGAERAARVRHRMAEGHAPLLVSLDPKTGIKIFAEEDKEAYEAGYICENCVQYQAVPSAPACNWLRNPNDGCGHTNY